MLKGTRGWLCLPLGYLFRGSCHADPGVCIGGANLRYAGSASWLAREVFLVIETKPEVRD